MTLEEYCRKEGHLKVRVREVDGKKYILVAWRHQDFKHLNGYVGVPKDSEFYGYTEWGDSEPKQWLNMHGGCTYSNNMPEFDLFGEDYHFIGFDTNHMNDLQPYRDGKWRTEGEFGIGERGGYKDMKYVWGEIENILKQITTGE